MSSLDHLPVVHKFFTKYIPDPREPNGMRAVDWVEYGPRGITAFDRNRTNARINDLKKIATAGDEGIDDPAILQARARWDAIEPMYRKWKESGELPDHGTPLSAWNGLSSDQAEIFKVNKIRTIEDLAAITDSDLRLIPLPNVREIREQAKLFLKSSDTNKAVAEIAALQEQNASQAETINDLTSKVSELANMVAEMQRGKPVPPKNKRGEKAA